MNPLYPCQLSAKAVFAPGLKKLAIPPLEISLILPLWGHWAFSRMVSVLFCKTEIRECLFFKQASKMKKNTLSPKQDLLKVSEILALGKIVC